jgi:hypothetical protein
MGTTMLIRESSDGTRAATELKLNDILLGKRSDPLLQADDILYVPPSTLKATAKMVMQSAMGFAAQAFVYDVQAH